MPNTKPTLVARLERADRLPPLPGALATLLGGCAADLRTAGADALLGVAIGHGVGGRFVGGSCSEHLCSLVAVGDGQGIDGRITVMPHMPSEVRGHYMRLPGDLGRQQALAPAMLDLLGRPSGEFETLHFRHLTVAMAFAAGGSAVEDIRIYADPAAERDAAERMAAMLDALFGFLGQWHMQLHGHRVVLPSADAFLRAA